MNPSLNRAQQTFLLSILSNAASGKPGTQKKLQEGLNKRVTEVLETPSIQKSIGNWDVVWGPVVYKRCLSRFATNSMYVARNGNQHVVAIAGTNPWSFYDWIFEDINVKNPVSWPYGEIPSSLHPKISKGTSLGLNILLKEMKSSGKTVLEFLGDTVKESADQIEIIFTGHSLGGALSPTLALAALDQKSEWAGEKPFKISVYPSAGPTPGNQDFSIYYDSRLGASTTRIWNKLDIVPHAWNETMLSEIPSLYEPKIEPGPFVLKGVESAEQRAKGGNYTQIVPKTRGLEGKVDLSRPGCPENSFKKKPLDKLSPFMAQAIYQHTIEYANLLNVKDQYCTIIGKTGDK